MPFTIRISSHSSFGEGECGDFFYLTDNNVEIMLYMNTIMIINATIETHPQPNKQPSSGPKPKVILLYSLLYAARFGSLTQPIPFCP